MINSHTNVPMVLAPSLQSCAQPNNLAHLTTLDVGTTNVSPMSNYVLLLPRITISANPTLRTDVLMDHVPTNQPIVQLKLFVQSKDLFYVMMEPANNQISNVSPKLPALPERRDVQMEPVFHS